MSIESAQGDESLVAQLDALKDKLRRVLDFSQEATELPWDETPTHHLGELARALLGWDGARLFLPPDPAKTPLKDWRATVSAWRRLHGWAKEFSNALALKDDAERAIWHLPPTSPGPVAQELVYAWATFRRQDNCLLTAWKFTAVAESERLEAERLLRLAAFLIAGAQHHLGQPSPHADRLRQLYERYETLEREVDTLIASAVPLEPERQRCLDLKRELTAVCPGHEDDRLFQHTVGEILRVAFGLPPECLKKEHPMHDGRKRLDLVYANRCPEGLFQELPVRYLIPCPYLLVECKNYSKDPKNPEIDQLLGHFGEGRGKVGVLVCNHIRARGNLLERCRDVARDGRGWILVFDSADLVAFLHARTLGRADVVWSLLDDHFRLLTF